MLTGITVRAATDVAPCTTVAEADPGGPTGDERGVAIERGNDPLAVQVGDRLDLWSVDDIAARGRLVVSGARVLDHDDRTVTVAIPAGRVGEVASGPGQGRPPHRTGALTAGAGARPAPQRSEEASSPRTPRPTTTR